MLKKYYENFKKYKIHILNEFFNQKDDFLQKNFTFEFYLYCLH